MHNIKMPKIHSSVYFLKHDIITLKIRFIEPLHDKTSDLDFAFSEDPLRSACLIRVFDGRWFCHIVANITKTCPCNILQYFTAVKSIIFR